MPNPQKTKVSTLKTPITETDFDCFKVYEQSNRHTFIHIEIEDTFAFYEKLFKYFFDEDKLIKYCENSSNLTFTPTQKHFAILYKHLKTYIDNFNLEKDVTVLNEEMLAIIEEEFSVTEKDGRVFARLDKMGKMGEYLFCCLLSEYFKFDCIIPKVHLQTDYNMPVFGIDTLFYSERDHFILFGESKLTVRINNGVKMINESLKEYEEQLETEFDLVLSNRLYKNKLKSFDNIFGEIAEISLSIRDFIEKASIKKIGVPIFIAHGKEDDEELIFNEMNKINCKDFFNLETVYYLISLPIIDKHKLVATFTKMIREKGEIYEDGAKQ